MPVVGNTSVNYLVQLSAQNRVNRVVQTCFPSVFLIFSRMNTLVLNYLYSAKKE